jgi:hypothetical protein
MDFVWKDWGLDINPHLWVRREKKLQVFFFS